MDLCGYGKRLSSVEDFVVHYLGAFYLWEDTVKNSKLHESIAKAIEESGEAITPDQFTAFSLKLLKIQEEALCKIFLDAVQKFDGDKILELAEAVWFFKPQFKANTLFDTERARLVVLKSRLNHAGEKWTARQAAEFIVGHKNPTKAEIDSIRGKCVEIGFPLKSERKIRKK